MISKELLSEVLGDERIKGENISVAGNLLHYDRLTHMTYINIYELAHKCKEWAYDIHGYTFVSGKFRTILWETTDMLELSFTGTTEHESIFKACEWIKANNDN